MYLENFSRSLIMDSHLNIAKGNSCMIEDTFCIDYPATKSSTSQDHYVQRPELFPRNNFSTTSTVSNLAYTQTTENNISALLLAQAKLHALPQNEYRFVDSEKRYNVGTLQQPQYRRAGSLHSKHLFKHIYKPRLWPATS